MVGLGEVQGTVCSPSCELITDGRSERYQADHLPSPLETAHFFTMHWVVTFSFYYCLSFDIQPSGWTLVVHKELGDQS